MRIPAECLSFIVFILFYSVLAAFDDHKSVFKILNTSVIKNGNSCAIVACNFLRLTDRPTAHTHAHHIHTYVHTYICRNPPHCGVWQFMGPRAAERQSENEQNEPVTLQLTYPLVFNRRWLRKQLENSLVSRERERQRREREREREGVDGHLSRALFIVSPLEHVENLIKLRLDSSIVCESFECKQ